MKNATYTIVIEKGYKIVREFNKAETIIEVIEKIFGTEEANAVRNWIKTTVTDGTYRNTEFYIHRICNI